MIRSIFAGSAPAADPESPTSLNPLLRKGSGARRDPSSNDIVDDDGGGDPWEESNEKSDDDAPDPVQLPQSTHSLLFTEPVLSFPFLFASVLMALSFACLFLALLHGLASGSVPVAVTGAVTAVQFLTIFVVLIMEEEIPTGLWLLRMIPRQSLRQKFPQMKYRKFIFSSALRILNGYCFLVNVAFVILHATGVLEIFYDVLALQFVQQLDDIAFILAQKDVLGKAMKRACTAKCFRAEFHKVRTGRTQRTRTMNIILKTIYFVNLGAMLGLMGVVSYRQRRGDFQHKSITVDFGDIIWERAWVTIPDWLKLDETEVPPGKKEKWFLLYAFFNGVYEKDSDLIDGRPVYKERRKMDTSHLSKDVDGNHFKSVVPAEIKYCSDIEAWVFTHALINKSNSSKKADQGCNWLLRSPPTDEFDLLNVESDWQAWVGVIGKAHVSIVTNRCSDDSDCNLNGICTDGKCVCESEDDGVQHFGSHCEVGLRDECRTILGEGYNEVYTADYSRDVWEEYAGDALLQMYDRPTYTYVEGSPEVDNVLLGVKDLVKRGQNVTVDYHLFYMYSGNRWFGTGIPTWNTFQNVLNMDLGDISDLISDYHAFWNKANYLPFISDPTTRSTPVGVDIFKTGYWTGEIGGQFGPFGALYPIQLHNQTGRGYFRCNDTESNQEMSRLLIGG